jgi:hypothetical protein
MGSRKQAKRVFGVPEVVAPYNGGVAAYTSSVFLPTAKIHLPLRGRRDTAPIYQYSLFKRSKCIQKK